MYPPTACATRSTFALSTLCRLSTCVCPSPHALSMLVHALIFRKLVLVLSDRDENVAAFFELWIAHMLKYPERKPNAWIVLLAEEGAGRGTRMARLVLASSLSRPSHPLCPHPGLLPPFTPSLEIIKQTLN